MKLSADWRAVLRHAWSIRLIALAALLSGIEAALPFFDGLLPIRPGVFGLLIFLVTLAAFVARLVAQKSLPATDPSAIRWDTGEPDEDQD